MWQQRAHSTHTAHSAQDEEHSMQHRMAPKQGSRQCWCWPLFFELVTRWCQARERGRPAPLPPLMAAACLLRTCVADECCCFRHECADCCWRQVLAVCDQQGLKRHQGG